jgi:hypothetical protein
MSILALILLGILMLGVLAVEPQEGERKSGKLAAFVMLAIPFAVILVDLF